MNVDMERGEKSSPRASGAQVEVERGERFGFGKNWDRFLAQLDESRIRTAEASLQGMLGRESLAGMSVLDAGSGSGLFSLAARRLGARVMSFDYDPDSVACTRKLRETYFPGDSNWHIEIGSVLDQQYLRSLGTFDIVYSWGVLHHTGDMWTALDYVAQRVAPNGYLYISIYNDQGFISKCWRAIKRTYNRSPGPIRLVLVLLVGAYLQGRYALRRALSGQNPLPFTEWRRLKQVRGMSVWHDLVDWVGGYPFEVAAPDAVFDFYRVRGFTLCRLRTDRAHGTNDYVFQSCNVSR